MDHNKGDKVHVIRAGSRPVYEVVVSEDQQKVTIREAEDHNHRIELISSVVPTVIKTLQEIEI